MLGIVTCSSDIISNRNVMLSNVHSLTWSSNRYILGSHQSMIVVRPTHQLTENFHIFAHNVEDDSVTSLTILLLYPANCLQDIWLIQQLPWIHSFYQLPHFQLKQYKALFPHEMPEWMSSIFVSSPYRYKIPTKYTET